jgi:hypothetical protein
MAPGEAYTDHQFRSNTYTGPRPTPTIPDGGRFSVYAETVINTPPHYPYDAIVDLHSWPEWNTFNPDALVTKHPSPHSRTLRLEQGTFMTVTTQLTPTERQQNKEVCMHLEPLKTRDDGKQSHKVTRIRWVSDNANYLVPRFVGKSERVNEIEEIENGKTRYRTWITFGGIAAKNIQKKYEKALQCRVTEFCHDLKERSEKLHAQDQKDGGRSGIMRRASQQARLRASMQENRIELPPRASLQQTRASLQLSRSGKPQ